MRARDRARIADPTIVEVFREFLTEQRARLGARTYRQYEEVVGLLTHCLDRHAYTSLDMDEAALLDRLHDAVGDDHREFTEVFGPEYVLEKTDDFLRHFMIGEVIAGKDLLRASTTVTKKLAKWLAEKGYADSGEAAEVVKLVADAARDLPVADDLCWTLAEFAEWDRQLTATERGYFELTRVEPGRIWVRRLAGVERGPIRLPPEVTELCPVGWLFSGMIGRHGRTWYIAEVRTVYPDR